MLLIGALESKAFLLSLKNCPKDGREQSNGSFAPSLLIALAQLEKGQPLQKEQRAGAVCLEVPGFNFSKKVKDGRKCNHLSVKITSSTKRWGVPGPLGKGCMAGEDLEQRGVGWMILGCTFWDWLYCRPSIFKLLLLFGQFPPVWGKVMCVGMLER